MQQRPRRCRRRCRIVGVHSRCGRAPRHRAQARARRRHRRCCGIAASGLRFWTLVCEVMPPRRRALLSSLASSSLASAPEAMSTMLGRRVRGIGTTSSLQLPPSPPQLAPLPLPRPALAFGAGAKGSGRTAVLEAAPSSPP
eukprot:364552-Chlamydomonas_euryale.AAC.11